MGKIVRIWLGLLPILVLHFHIVWIHHILPPIIGNAIDLPASFGKMFQPPFMMLTGIPIPPIPGRHLAFNPFKVGKIVQPVITLTDHSGGIAPVIITDAVRREVDVSKGGIPGTHPVVAAKAFPQIVRAVRVSRKSFA